jgi:hypothetical protein
MLRDQIFEGAAWVDSDSRPTNTTGTPVVSAVANRDGRGLADEYFLTFAAVVVGVSANVTVTTTSPNNPYRATRAVALDGLTVHKDVIPGLDIVFSANAGFTGAWAATIKVGEFLGTFDAFGGGAGVPSAGVRHRVLNDGTGAVSNAKARVLPTVKWVKKVGTVFSGVKPFAEGSTEKVAGGGSSRVVPYVLSISAVAGAGAGKTCTVSVDGVAFPAASLRDLSTGNTQDGTLVKAVAPGNYYRVILGNLIGLEFAIDAGVANGDAANVLIFAPRFIQIAADVAGVASAYGTADIILTEAGQAAGTIQPGGTAFYWRRVLVPAGGNAESNPVPGDIALTAVLRTALPGAVSTEIVGIASPVPGRFKEAVAKLAGGVNPNGATNFTVYVDGTQVGTIIIDPASAQGILTLDEPISRFGIVSIRAPLVPPGGLLAPIYFLVTFEDSQAAIRRNNLLYTTPNLAAGVTDTTLIPLGRSFALYRVQTSAPARVRLYTRADYRTADASRPYGTPISGENGLILDIQTTLGNLTIDQASPVLGANLEDVVTDDVAASVTNLSGVSAAITLTITRAVIEGAGANPGFLLTVEEADGAPSLEGNKLIVGAGDLSQVSPNVLRLKTAGDATVAIRELDGAPNLSTVRALVVGNGDLTDLGGGSARLKTAADVTLPASLPPSGAASGDLGSNYPNPTVTGLGGSALPANVADGFFKRNTANTGWELYQLIIGGKLDPNLLPAIALNTRMVVANQAAMLALTSADVQPGDFAFRTDNSEVYLLLGTDPSLLASWVIWQHPAIPTTLPPSGAASGDLGNNYPNPTVTGLGGSALPANIVNGFLKRNAANNGWEQVTYGTVANTICQGNDGRLSDSRAPSGAAGGDLGSNYPNPIVAAIRTIPVKDFGASEFLSDNFNDNAVAAIWGRSSITQVREINNRMELYASGAGAADNVYTINSYDMTNRYLQCKVGGASGWNVWLRLGFAGAFNNYLEVRVNSGGNIQTNVHISSDTAQTTRAYSSSNDQWWRFLHRSSDNTWHWYNSPDGSTWNEVGTGVPPPNSNNATQCRFQAYGIAASIEWIDDFNSNIPSTATSLTDGDTLIYRGSTNQFENFPYGAAIEPITNLTAASPAPTNLFPGRSKLVADYVNHRLGFWNPNTLTWDWRSFNNT